jgi:molybdate transport system substrate-binding protein
VPPAGVHQGAASFPVTAAASFVALAALIAVLAWVHNQGMKSVGDGRRLMVYCAVSVQPVLRPIAEAFERESGATIDVQTGSSGALETQIRLSRKGDLFIPAARTPYLDRCQADGTVTDVVPLAEFRLVLALRPTIERDGITLDDLLQGQLRYAIANDEAAAGLVTRQVLEPLGVWPRIRDHARVFLPTVTGVAQAVQQGVAVDCGFVWDTTARQFGLPIVDLPELAAGRAVVAAGVLSCSRDAAAARRFADYLATPDQGQAVFRKLGYTTP